MDESSDVPPPPTPPRATETPTSAKRVRRTWPQRLMIGATFVMAALTFGAAGVLYAGQRVLEARDLAPELLDPRRLDTETDTAQPDDATGTADPTDVSVADATETDGAAPTPTFPDAEPEAMNFLITGADNHSCIDPNSPYAPAFDRTNLSERSDTIMVWRVNPATSQVAVLSFPRDLWVPIAGHNAPSRINSAYERGNPQKLIDTLWQNFQIPIDHYVQVDFCAFYELVDAVGGVTVPFSQPVRDPNTGLNVPEAGCYTFNGEHALAYVRSRKLEYVNDAGQWKQDPSADLGRISRQQDFLRRTVAALLDKGAYNPDVASGLIDTLTQYVTTDDALTAWKMKQFAGVLAGIDPTQITTYQINSTRKIIQGNDVLEPAIKGENMRAVLAVFRGEATLAGAPEQVLGEDADGNMPTETTLGPVSTDPATSDPGTSDPATADTLPVVEAEQNVYGIVPDPNIICP